MKSGTVANQATLEAWRVAVIFQEATMVEHRMTAVAYLPVVLLSDNGQFRRESCRRIYTGSILVEVGNRVRAFFFPQPAAPVSVPILLLLSRLVVSAEQKLTGTNLASFVSCGRGSIVQTLHLLHNIAVVSLRQDGGLYFTACMSQLALNNIVWSRKERKSCLSMSLT